MRLRISLFIMLALVTFTSSNGQVIGKIFDTEYANQTFGNVVNSVEIENSELTSLLQNAGDYIMFNIDTKSVRALDGNRTSVQGNAVSENEVFYKMSASQVELLLNKGSQNSTAIEMRPETLTLTNGDFTLEMSDPCPPNCG